MKIVIVLLALLMAGCATTLTEEEQQEKAFEREWKRGIDAENWRMCELMYKQAGKQTLHVDHQHNRRGPPRHWEIKSDLMYNQCRMYLKKEYWAEY